MASLLGVVGEREGAAPPITTLCGILRVCGIYCTDTMKAVQCYVMYMEPYGQCEGGYVLPITNAITGPVRLLKY